MRARIQQKKPKRPIYRKGPGIPAKKEAAIRKCFIYDMEASKAAATVGVNKETAHLHYKHFREAIYTTFSKAPLLEGEVEIDIAEFGGKGRKRMRELLKKYARTLTHFEYQEKAKAIRAANKTKVMVFAQRGGRVFAHVVKTKSADDLMPLVRLVVAKGSRIYSDQEPGLARLAQDGYEHKTMNHKELHAYELGVHTANADAFFSIAKRRLAKFNGLMRHTTPLHIKECVWRYNHRNHDKKELDAILKALMTDSPQRRIQIPKRGTQTAVSKIFKDTKRPLPRARLRAGLQTANR